MAATHNDPPLINRIHIAGGISGTSTSAPKMHIAAAPASKKEPGSNNHAEYHGG